MYNPFPCYAQRVVPRCGRPEMNIVFLSQKLSFCFFEHILVQIVVYLICMFTFTTININATQKHHRNNTIVK